MEDDPDIEAMANKPILDQRQDDTENLDTTVIEGGPSGGLFLPDGPESDSDIELAEARVDQLMDDGVDSDTYVNDQLIKDQDAIDSERDDDRNEDDKDDPIVATHNIYATNKLGEHLYLLQYPIRPPNRPYVGVERPTEARMKPRSNLLEVDVPIPETAYYDRVRGTQWTDSVLRTQTLAGRLAGGRNYLVGIMHEGHLHVTPLKGVAQLRPNFKYIDQHDSEEKEIKKNEAQNDKAVRAIKAIQVSAKSADAMPDLSTTSILRAAEEESWVKLPWHDQTAEESERIYTHLATTRTDIVCESLTNKQEYLNLLSTIKAPVAVDEVKVKKQ